MIYITFGNDRFCQVCLQPLDVYQSYEDGVAVYGCLVCAAVDAWCLNSGSLTSCFLHIDPCAVESAEIIDDCHHELQRVVCLNPETLKALNGVRG